MLCSQYRSISNNNKTRAQKGKKEQRETNKAKPFQEQISPVSKKQQLRERKQKRRHQRTVKQKKTTQQKQQQQATHGHYNSIMSVETD